MHVNQVQHILRSKVTGNKTGHVWPYGVLPAYVFAMSNNTRKVIRSNAAHTEQFPCLSKNPHTNSTAQLNIFHNPTKHRYAIWVYYVISAFTTADIKWRDSFMIFEDVSIEIWLIFSINLFIYQSISFAMGRRFLQLYNHWYHEKIYILHSNWNMYYIKESPF